MTEEEIAQRRIELSAMTKEELVEVAIENEVLVADREAVRDNYMADCANLSQQNTEMLAQLENYRGIQKSGEAEVAAKVAVIQEKETVIAQKVTEIATKNATIATLSAELAAVKPTPKEEPVEEIETKP